MYNKYIGNTGKYIRVEEHPRVNARDAERPVANMPPPLQHAAQKNVPSDPVPQQPPDPPPRTEGAKNKPLLGGLGSGLGGLLGGLGNGLGGLTSGFRGMFDHLPFGLDIGDILLFLLLLFFFIESGDEEFIIILAVIGYSMFKER